MWKLEDVKQSEWAPIQQQQIAPDSNPTDIVIPPPVVQGPSATGPVTAGAVRLQAGACYQLVQTWLRADDGATKQMDAFLQSFKTRDVAGVNVKLFDQIGITTKTLADKSIRRDVRLKALVSRDVRPSSKGTYSPKYGAAISWSQQLESASC